MSKIQSPSRTIKIDSIKTSDIERFWSKVSKNGDEDCWNWNGYKNDMGYGKFGVGGRNGSTYLAHRIAYTLLVGEIESGLDIDHMCHNPACVNPKHLRACVRAENARNSRLRKNNKSGFKGVCWFERDSNWVAYICANGKRKNLGYYDTPEEAHAAYCKAAKELHGEFANFGGAV
jgi:hypothetical protein